MRFIDECQLELIAGDGGDGIIAWRREAHNAMGGPNGGDGGKGGDIIVKASESVQNLFHLHHLKKIKAENGQNGQNDCMVGRGGQDRFIMVPVGTSIYDQNNQLICDLTTPNQTVIVCHGGRPGLGNAKFKSSQNRAPSIYERGDLGESKCVHFVLRFLANVGIIGLPNAGKSTLINTLARTSSRVANYPFTTLVPVLGVVFYQKQKLLFADLPGLIEHASEGKGLGDDFLKHVERCQVLIHLISMDPVDNRDIIDAYQVIQKELSNYSTDLLQKKIMVVANKADAFGASENYAKLTAYLNQSIPFISAKNNQLENLIPLVFNQYNQTPPVPPTKQVIVRHYTAPRVSSNQLNNLVMKQTDEGWKITHPQLTYWLRRIPLVTQDNIQHFKNQIKRLGLADLLKQKHLQLADKIIIGEYEFNLSDFC